MPEQLDQDQWQASITWTEAHPNSHHDYPSPSPLSTIVEIVMMKSKMRSRPKSKESSIQF